MKKIILLALFSSTQYFATSQSCLPGGITFLTQSDVDNFPTNHPNCTEIEGSVYLLSTTDIHDLDGLSQVEHIWGDLLISGNTALESISGLSGLITIGQACRIQNNPVLANLDGLENLSSVSGDFFYIGSNDLLSDIDGLSGLDSIGGIFHLWGHPQLVTLQGLGQLQQVGDNLAIFENEQLTTLGGLGALTDVGNDLRFENNPLLSDISSLQHPVSIQGALAIIGNLSLSNCAVKAVCDYIAAPASFMAISGNANNCQSVQEVETACLTAVAGQFDSNRLPTALPNPTNGPVRILADDPDLFIIKVMDITGRSLDLIPSEPLSIDLNGFAPGIYWIAVSSKSGRAIIPVIKM